MNEDGDEKVSLLGSDSKAGADVVDGNTGLSRQVFGFGVAAAACYSLTYFWRFAIFVLPMDVLEQNVCTLFGASVDLQAAFSLALTIGFGLAKIPAISVMSSEFFFAHRFLFLISLLWVSMMFMAIGTSAFYHVLAAQVLCVFVSCFVSSWIYGGIITYLEGRSGTEALLATMNFFFIYAGNLSRGTASLMLEFGVPPYAMPATLGLICCPLSTGFLYLINLCPPPSHFDISQRSARTALSPEAKWIFLSGNALGIVCMLIPYVLLASLRSFRDFYAQEIFTASLGRTDNPPSYVYFTVDIPGAVLSCIIQYSFHYCDSNAIAFTGMLITMILSVFAMLISTIVYDASEASELSGFCWQVMIGVGIYGAYAMLGAAAWDRLISLLRVGGTCSFLVFMADGCGYVGTTTLLLYQTFGTNSDADDDQDDHSARNSNYLNTFVLLVYFGSVVVMSCLSLAGVYFLWKSGSYSEVQYFFSPCQRKIKSEI